MELEQFFVKHFVDFGCFSSFRYRFPFHRFSESTKHENLARPLTRTFFHKIKMNSNVIPIYSSSAGALVVNGAVRFLIIASF